MSGARVVGVPPVMLIALMHCRIDIPRKYTLAGRWNCSHRFFTAKLIAVYYDTLGIQAKAISSKAELMSNNLSAVTMRVFC